MAHAELVEHPRTQPGQARRPEAEMDGGLAIALPLEEPCQPLRRDMAEVYGVGGQVAWAVREALEGARGAQVAGCDQRGHHLALRYRQWFERCRVEANDEVADLERACHAGAMLGAQASDRIGSPCAKSGRCLPPSITEDATFGCSSGRPRRSHPRAGSP